jgi:hypothetical protein
VDQRALPDRFALEALKNPNFKKTNNRETGNFPCQFSKFFKINLQIFSQCQDFSRSEGFSVETFISVV